MGSNIKRRVRNIHYFMVCLILVLVMVGWLGMANASAGPSLSGFSVSCATPGR